MKDQLAFQFRYTFLAVIHFIIITIHFVFWFDSFVEFKSVFDRLKSRKDSQNNLIGKILINNLILSTLLSLCLIFTSKATH